MGRSVDSAAAQERRNGGVHQGIDRAERQIAHLHFNAAAEQRLLHGGKLAPVARWAGAVRPSFYAPAKFPLLRFLAALYSRTF